jgi:hypothetical protein
MPSLLHVLFVFALVVVHYVDVVVGVLIVIITVLYHPKPTAHWQAAASGFINLKPRP